MAYSEKQWDAMAKSLVAQHRSHGTSLEILEGVFSRRMNDRPDELTRRALAIVQKELGR